MVDHGVRSAVIVGAGFIGLELAENLIHRNVATTVIELQDQVLPPLDREMTTSIARALEAHGVDLRLGHSAESFEAVDDGIRVRMRGGEEIVAQLVLLGIGVRPESTLAANAGLEVGPRGGIRVDEHMRTSDPSIYAVGDAVEIRGFVTGVPTQIPLAGPANRQGRIAADNIFGRDSRFRGVQGTAILGLFEIAAAVTGETEKSLRRAGTPYGKIYVHPAHHAGYYPGARSMTLKLLFEPQSGKILGGQVVGEEGVDKRIDVLSVALQASLTVFDLEECELAYAPQFGSAKDAINMAGFLGAAVVRGDYPQVHVEDLPALLAGTNGPPAILIDVRTPAEFVEGHIDGARNIPLDSLRTRLAELPRDRKIVVTCQAGQRGYVGTLQLRQAGLDAANLGGGYKTYTLH